jgi:hypothetical protein
MKLMARDVGLGVDFVLKHRAKTYVSAELFLDDINCISIPYVNKRWQSEEFAGCEAVLLMANYSPHMGNAIIAVLTREHVRVITFATDTTHIFQVLDLALFTALKKRAPRLSTLDEEQSAAEFVIRAYHDFRQIMAEVNIWGAFSSIGFSYHIAQKPHELLFDEETSDRVEASSNSGGATCHSRVCRGEGNKQGLDG